jgi:small subunit ribosomal protein S6
MPLYESVYIARQDVSATQVEALTEGFTTIITENGGTVTKTEYWGLKSFAYRIKKNRKGHYVLMNIDAPSAAVAEMERLMGINEDVLRTLTLRMDVLEEGPSAMMQSRAGRDRDGRDRDGRGDRDSRGGDRDRGERRDRGFGPRDPAEGEGVPA